MWIRRHTQPLREAAPVVEKTPEQLAEMRAAEKERWEERNPLRRWLITFMDGSTREVTAHRCSDGGESRIVLLRTRYGVTAPFGTSYLSEVVYWTHSHLVSSVEMLDE